MTEEVIEQAGKSARWAADLPLLKQGTKADLYLKSRGVGFKRYPQDLRMDKAENLVALIRDPVGRIASYQRIFLQFKAGTWQKTRKIMKNPEGYNIPLGSAIRLGKPGKILGCAEGIENAFSASLISGRNKDERIPVWAAVTSAMLKTFRPPIGVERYYAYADNDRNMVGINAAEESIKNTLAREAHISMPIDVGEDWNSVLQRLRQTDKGLKMLGIIQKSNAVSNQASLERFQRDYALSI